MTPPWQKQKYSHIERERKFWLEALPKDLALEAFRVIEDRYFPDTRLRLRKIIEFNHQMTVDLPPFARTDVTEDSFFTGGSLATLSQEQLRTRFEQYSNPLVECVPRTATTGYIYTGLCQITATTTVQEAATSLR
jgi:hypothetical protein